MSLGVAEEAVAGSDLVERFEAHLAGLQGRSPRTVRAYGGEVRALAAFLAGRGLELAGAGKAEVRAFIFELKGRGLAASSIGRALAGLRSFYRWRLKEGETDFNPAAQVAGPKTSRDQALFRVLTEREAEILLTPPAGAAEDDPVTWRDQALFELAYSAGLRVGELVGLDLEHLDLNRLVVTVRRGKGGKDRLAPFGRPAAEALAAYLAVRGRLAVPDRSGRALFLGRRGRRLSDREVRRALAARLAAAGLDRGFSPHSLRHSFATHLL
ncbi:MAG: tyrosine-type recombinase/integrase, partial [Candidatus Adiutrix sp.]|nr:tyrosine-type recombinase/integrase [Candidatus Adiutrix sp.]